MKAVQSTRCIEYTRQSSNSNVHQSVVRSKRELGARSRANSVVLARIPMVVEQTRMKVKSSKIVISNWTIYIRIMPKLVKANINSRGLTINAAEINSHKVMTNKIHTIIFYIVIVVQTLGFEHCGRVKHRWMLSIITYTVKWVKKLMLHRKFFSISIHTMAITMELPPEYPIKE